MNELTYKLLRITRNRWLPWLIIAGVLVVAAYHEIFQPPWVEALSRQGQAMFWVLALAGLLLIYFIVERLTARLAAVYESQERLRRRAERAEHLVDKAYQRLEAIFRISQKFVEASDENEVVELVLRLSVELVGALGASYVPLDEHGQPLSASSYGEMPIPVVNDWVEYLASPAVRQRCQACQSHGTLNTDQTCPLLKGPFSEAIGLFCLPLRRGDREYGVLNLFIPKADQLDAQSRTFLAAMIDETALALEGVQLRRRELSALRQMQSLRQKTDLSALLTSLVGDVYHSLETDFAMLIIQEANRAPFQTVEGTFPGQAKPFVDGIVQGVMASSQPVILGDVAGEGDSSPGIRTLMAAPIHSQERASIGVLLVGKRSAEGFHPRQLALLQTIAGQVSLVVQNANQMAELEFKTLMEERSRLAREIHDGLAQTLGFLKLQMAQMQGFLARSELDRLRQSMELCYATLSEAYQDARQAIDGLRISPNEAGLVGWLEQMIAEFEELSEIQVELVHSDLHSDLPPEVQAQLIRIVQEALSNVRKHANATRVWISCREIGGDFWLEVKDNGQGFLAEDVPGPSQHGLRGMRERSDLISADFQVVSRPDEGTTVQVCVPVEIDKGYQGMHSGEIGS